MLRSFRSLWTQKDQRKRTRALRRGLESRPMLEGLEDRTVPSITFSGPGNTGTATLTGIPGADMFAIQLKAGDATTIEFSDDNGQTFTDAHLSDITAVQVNGLAGNDRLRINEANGFVATAGGLPITFDGGHGFNVLAVRGNSGDTTISETFTPTGPFGGTLAMTDGTNSATITLQSVDHIFDTSTADTLTVNADNHNNFIHIGFGLQADHDGLITNTIRALDFRRIDDNGGHDDDPAMVGDPTDDMGGSSNDNHDDGNPAELQASRAIIPFTFANKTHVVVNGLGGDDLFVLSIHHGATGMQSLTLDGGTGTNVLAARVFPQNVTLTLVNIQHNVSDPATIFIYELYMSRLGRPTEDAVVAAYVNFFNTNGAAATVAAVEDSVEGRLNLVRQLYVHYLGRMPSDTEAMGWVAALQSGMTEEQVVQSFLASAEFFSRAQQLGSSGDANANFAQAMFQIVFNRAGNSIEVGAFALAAATLGPDAVAAVFIASPEFRTNVITMLYTTILHRPPDIGGLTGWVNSSMSLQDIRIAFLASGEAFANG
jgi:hypothetical protein